MNIEKTVLHADSDHRNNNNNAEQYCGADPIVFWSASASCFGDLVAEFGWFPESNVK